MNSPALSSQNPSRTEGGFLLPRRRGIGAVLATAGLCCALGFGTAFAQKPGRPAGHLDVRVNAPAPAIPSPAATAQAVGKTRQGFAKSIANGTARLQARVPSAEVKLSDVTGAVEIVSSATTLTEAAPGRSGIEIVTAFLRENAELYGLAAADLASLHFLGESVSEASGLRMVRVEQTVNGIPVFQSETRFTIDRDGRLIRSVGRMIPNATAAAAAPATKVAAHEALATALGSVGINVDPARMASKKTPAGRDAVEANHPSVKGSVPSDLVYFPAAPGVLIPAWSQVTMTATEEGDWFTLVDANGGSLLWRKNIRSHVSTQEARFSVYVQADGKTPADSPAPLSPTTATAGSGFQPTEIARTTVSMSAVQNLTASPNGWIADGGNTTIGNNVNAYLDRNSDDVADAGTLDNNGRPIGNLDTNGRNRDFLGTNFAYVPPPTAGNTESGTAVTDAQMQRGVVTQLFYLTNWYHDRLFALGFDEAAGNYQTTNFSGSGTGNDAVLAEAQDAAGNASDGSNRNNANFSSPPDGTAGRMQMYIFDGPTVDRDGSLDAEIVLHELTHGLTNRLIGNGSGLNWEVGGGMGEGWSDFYALSLLNNTNADNPNGKYAAGAYATYKLAGLTDNYLYGIRRFPYSTDNAVNPLTWADVDDTSNSLSGGITPSPLNFNGNGAGEVHNIGEIWAMTLWEVRSRIIADPAGANGDVPTGNNRTLQIVTDALKMTPSDPSFLDARDAILAADAATNAAANEASIWAGFADRGLGYKAVAPFSRMFGYRAGHVSIGESFDVPYLDVQSVAIDDSLGNNNGAIDPNENVRITVKLKNPWRRASFGVASASATLSTSTVGVNITTNAATYPAIPALGSGDGTKFQFRAPAGATAGQALKFTINVTSSLGTKAVDFTLRVGAASGTGTPITYTRSAVNLAIPDNSPRGVVDSLTVTDDFEIADLNFRVDSLTHTAVGDLTLLLRAPNGLGTDLINVIGGLTDGGPGDNLTNTVIDDQASGDLLSATATSAPFTGSWKPIYNVIAWSSAGFHPDTVGTLSRYNGLSTQGIWKVLVSDQGAADTGTLNGWSLIVTPRAFTTAALVAPTLTATAAALSYLENQAATAIDPGLTITDSDSANLVGATVSITSGFLTGQDVLGFVNQNGITGSYDSSTGVLTLTGTATVANYRTALRSVTFASTSDNPGTARTVRFSVDDGSLTGSATRTIAVTPVNDPPTATNLSAAETYTEDTPLDLKDIVVSDVDSANLSVRLTVFMPAAGSLTTGVSGGVVSTYNAVTGVWTANGPIADVNVLLANVSFVPAPNFNDTFSIVVDISDSSQTIVGTKSFIGIAVDDPPTATNLSVAETYTEDTPLNLADIAVADVDNTSVTATLTLSDRTVGSFSTAKSGAVTSVYNPSSGVWTAAGAIADVNILLAGVSFIPARDVNANFTIATRVSTGVATALTGTKSVTGIAVNDMPTISVAPVVSPIPEDSGEQSMALSNISAGGGENQQFTITAVSSNPAVIPDPVITYTYPDTTGVLTFTPLPNTSGSAQIVITVKDNGGTANGGSDTSISAFAVDVAPVNDAPSFTKGADITRLEDAGAQSIAGWATAISAGPADEAAQSVHFIVSSDNAALFSTAPAVAANGTLTFTAAPDASGTANVAVQLQDDGGIDNGGVDTSDPQTFKITITPVNDPPTFTKGSNRTVLEDAGAQTVVAWATDISAGPNESTQALSFQVTNDNAALFSTAPAVASNGALTFTPAANANGTATVSVTLHDDGGTANGGSDTSATQTFTITVTSVNDAPSFTKGANITRLEDAGAQTIPGWATAISPGPTDEATQQLDFIVSSDNAALFAVAPAVATDGTLTFTPAANASGTATVTVRLHDDGGTSNGGVDTSAPQTFTIDVTAVNDAPSFTKGSDITRLEDAGAQSIAGWATAISAGPADEAAQSVHFIVSSDNAALFSTAPAVAANGTLTFTAAPDANGSAVVTVQAQDNGGTANGGVDTSEAQTFKITITPVNDPPTIDALTDRTLPEDAGEQTISLSGIGTGAANETQTLTVTATSDKPELITDPSVTYTSPGASGSINFKPAANMSGAATITVTVNDGGAENATFSRTFTVNVTAINDAPTFTKGSDRTVLEDAGAQTFAAWATDISAGADDESTQALNFEVTSDNAELFSAAPAVAANGTLTFTPAANANGTATVSVTLHDDGGTANGGVDTSATQTFTITVTSVNDTPSFTKGANISARQNAGAQTVAAWATAISAGPSDEAAQAVSFVVSNDNPTIFAVAPSIASNGTLSFTPASSASGTATVTVTAHDDGGTANGGSDTSAAQTFTITTTFVNDAPSFTISPSVEVSQDAPGQTFAGWAANISAGPADESPQALNFIVEVSDPSLFDVQPALSATGTLTFTPRKTASGTATITVRLHDTGGTNDGGVDTSAPQTFTIAVTTYAEELGTYNGLATPAPAGPRENARTGSIKVTVAKGGKFTGRLKLGAFAFPLAGSFDKSGVAHFGRDLATTATLKRAKDTPLSLTLQLDVARGTDKLSGEVKLNGQYYALIDSDRALYTAKRNPVAPFRTIDPALVGSYTTLLPAKTPAEQGLAAAQFPQGTGFGVIKIAKDGTAKFVGTLADGSKVSCSNPLSKLNTWPIFQPLNARKGSLSGVARIFPVADVSDIDASDLLWFRPPMLTAKRYASGWSSGITVDLVAARYSVAKTSPVVLPGLGAPQAGGNSVAILSDGGVGNHDIEKQTNVDSFNKVTVINADVDGLTLKLTTASGFFTGSFVHPQTGKKVSIHGAVLQKQKLGGGFFLGPTESGNVYFGVPKF